MNFKKTALVLAMAGIVAAPMAAQASAGDGAYASIRIGLQSIEKNGGFGAVQTPQSAEDIADGIKAPVGSDSTTISGYSSRFGFKSETDLGNGMTGFGQYEFQVGTEQTSFDATANNTIRVRKAFVGVKGDFGSVHVGTGYQTFYNHVVAGTDNPWAGSGYAMVAYRGRQANNLTYAGSAGAVSYGITLQMNGQGTDAAGDQEIIDATELGLSFDAGFGTFGVAMLSQQLAAGADSDVIGLLLSGVAAGPVTLGFGYQSGEASGTTAEPTSFLIDATMGGGYIHYETLDADTANGAGDADALTLGYTMSIGPQTSAWFEYHNLDVDAGTGVAGNTGDLSQIRAIMKYDI